MPRQTPSQTVGPFFSHALTPLGPGRGQGPGNRLCDGAARGEPIRIQGRVTDGNGDTVPDAMVEIWQADGDGQYPDGDGAFRGFGRAGTDDAGRYWFETVMPGSPAPGVAPHIAACVFARGMLNHAFTRIYFSDRQDENARDFLLASVDPSRAPTLIARRVDGPGRATYEFDIRLQGESETVFLDA